MVFVRPSRKAAPPRGGGQRHSKISLVSRGTTGFNSTQVRCFSWESGSKAGLR
jgi:hypothetical protein